MPEQSIYQFGLTKDTDELVYRDPVTGKALKPERVGVDKTTDEYVVLIDGITRKTGIKSSHKETGVKALGGAWQAGSLEAGLAGIKAYQAIGGVKELGTEIGKNVAYAPQMLGRAFGELKRDIGLAVGKPQPSSRYEPKSDKMKELEAFEKEQTNESVQRFNTTKDIADFYEKEIEGIKSKYKENDITQMVESLPLSVSGMIASRVPVVGTAAQAYVFGGSAAQDFINKAFAEDRQKPENKNYSDDELRARTIDKYKLFASLSGGVQAGGEIVGNKLLTKVIPQNLPIKNKLLKLFATMLGGGVSEGVEEGPLQEGGTILAEKAAGLQTGPVGERIWQAGKIGAMSGLLLGGGGHALNTLLTPKTKAVIAEANKNPTQENKNKVEEAIIGDWALAPEESKQEFLKSLTPEQRKVFEASITAEQEKTANLAAENVQVKAELSQATKDPATQLDVLTYSPKNKVWNDIKQNISIGGFDIKGLKSVNDLANNPEGDTYLAEAAKTWGVEGETNAYAVGSALKKLLANTAKKINNQKYGNRFEIEIKGADSDEFVSSTRSASPEELNAFLADVKKAMPVVKIPSIKKTEEFTSAGSVSYKVVDNPSQYDSFEKAYNEALNMEKRATPREPTTEKAPAKAKTDREVRAVKETQDEQITAFEETKPEMVESQLSKRLQNLAVKDNLLGKYVDELGNEYQKTFGALPEHEKMNMKEQAQKNIKLINSDPGLAYQIATGEKTVTGYRQDTMYAALVNRAFAQGDAEMIQDLASDPNFTGETTKSGQWLRSLAEIQPENPIRAIADLKKTREEAQSKRGKDKKTIKEAKIKDRTAVENSLKSNSFTENGRVSSKKKTWADFLEKIKC